MKTKNNQIFVFIIYVFISLSCFSQNNDLQKDMKLAFDVFDKGKVFKDWLKGAEMMSVLGYKYKKEWLPNYWASYFYSQVARSYPKGNPPKKITTKDLLDLSQENYNKAFEKGNITSSKAKSDFYVLQSLIYNFRVYMSNNEQIKKDFRDEAEKELKSAIHLDQNNPLVHVLIATQLVNRKDYMSAHAVR